MDPSEFIEEQERVGAVDEAIKSLPLRTQQIINLRYGMEGSEHTMNEIGEIVGVSKQQIHYILAKSFRMLRHPNHRHLMEHY